MQFSKSLLLSLVVIGATAFDHIYARDEANANDQLEVRNAIQAAHDISLRSTDPDLFRRELTNLAKRGCVQGGRGACIRGKCSTSRHYCYPNGCACD